MTLLRAYALLAALLASLALNAPPAYASASRTGCLPSPCQNIASRFEGLAPSTVALVASLEKTTPAALVARWTRIEAETIAAAREAARGQGLDAASAERYVAARVARRYEHEAALLLTRHPELRALVTASAPGKASLGGNAPADLAGVILLVAALVAALAERRRSTRSLPTTACGGSREGHL